MLLNHRPETVRYQHGGRRNPFFRQGVKALSEGSGALRLGMSHNQDSGSSGYSLRISRSCSILRLLKSDLASSPAVSRTLQSLNSLSICVQSPYYAPNGFMASTELEPRSRVLLQVHHSGPRRL